MAFDIPSSYQWAIPFGIVALFWIGAWIAYHIVGAYIHKLAKKTKSDLDDILVERLKKPFYWILILLGIYFGLAYGTTFDRWQQLIKDIFFVIVVFWLAIVIFIILDVAVPRWLKVRGKFDKTPKVFNRIVMVLVYLIALLFILEHFNVKITPLITALGIGGIAIGFALQDTLSNFFAGMQIVSDKPVNIGDFVEIDNDVKGYVEDIGWRTTKLRTLANSIIIMPNSKMAQSIIFNHNQPQEEESITVKCGVDYGSDLEKVEKVSIEVATQIQKTVKGARKGYEPSIRFNEFADSNIKFSVNLMGDNYVARYLITHEFIKALKKRFDKEGIEISWPINKVYIKKQ